MVPEFNACILFEYLFYSKLLYKISPRLQTTMRQPICSSQQWCECLDQVHRTRGCGALELAEFHADNLVLSRHRGAIVKFLKCEALGHLIFSLHDARLENVAVEVEIDGSRVDDFCQAIGEPASFRHHYDPASLDVSLLGGVDFSNTHQHCLGGVESGSQS